MENLNIDLIKSLVEHTQENLKGINQEMHAVSIKSTAFEVLGDDNEPLQIQVAVVRDPSEFIQKYVTIVTTNYKPNQNPKS